MELSWTSEYIQNEIDGFDLYWKKFGHIDESKWLSIGEGR